MRKILLIVAVAAALAAPSRARAQYINPYKPFTQFGTPMGAYLDLLNTQSIDSQLMRNSIARKYGLDGGETTVAPTLDPAMPRPQPLPPAPFEISDFAPTGKGHFVLDEMLADTKDPAVRQLVQTLATSSFSVVESQGRKNNVAFAMAYATGVAVFVVTGRDMSWGDMRDLAAAVNKDLAINPGFLAMSSFERQRHYESAIILSGVMVGMQELATRSNDATLLANARETATATLKQIGFIRGPAGSGNVPLTGGMFGCGQRPLRITAAR